MMSRKSASRLVVRCLLVLAVIGGRRGTSVAQTVNGSFHGVVSDSTGAVVPGATIVVKNRGTGAIRQATSDAAGLYTLTQIPPAVYTITVSKPAFKTLVQDVELL